MACTEHNLYIPAEHFNDSKQNIGTDEIELKFCPQEFDMPLIIVDIKTKDGVKFDSHIELSDAIALRDYLDTIIPTMEKIGRKNRS
jgi:hypothetical protein